jgi:multiple sugar transport system permease protein
MAAFVLLPLYWLVVASTKSTRVLFNSGTFSPSGLGSLWTNVQTLFSYSGSIFGYWMVNSLGYALVVATLATYIAAATGYALAKFQFVGRGAVLLTIVASLMVPATVLFVPLFILERFVGLTNSYEGVVLPLIVWPFGCYFMFVFSNQAVPEALLDAARVDGAGEWRIFHRIALPVMKPGVVTLFLIAFVGTWNNFFLPLVLLADQKLFPVTVGLSMWLSQIHLAGVSEPLYPEVLLGCLVSVLPMLVIFPFLRRHIAAGLAFGALAGE